MPPIENLIFEFTSFALGLVILVKLWKNPNKFHLIGFAIAIITTASIELFGVRESNSYYYADFLINIDQLDPVVISAFGGTGRDFPLFIAVDWAVIVFVLWRMGTRLQNIKWYLRPLVFGLVAVILDLALDPVAAKSKLIPNMGDPCVTSTVFGAAEGVGHWVWCIPNTPSEFWLGVPVANFYGWFLVIAVFMTFYLAAHRYAYSLSTGIQFATLVAAMSASLIVFFTLLNWFLRIDFGISGWWILGGLLLAGVIALIRAGLDRPRYKVDWWALRVVGGNVLFCVATYIFQLMGLVSIKLVLLVALWLLVSVLITLWIQLGKRLIGLPYP